MVRLTEKQVAEKVAFIKEYTGNENASSSSEVDPNSNVVSKNMVTMSAEIQKDFTIQINRGLMKEYMGEELHKQYIEDLESHLIYTHDESSLYPYCVSINMWPFMQNGMSSFDSNSSASASDAPQHLRSYCGGFVNLVQYVASNFAGAVATVEFLLNFDYFARKDFGDNYLETHRDIIEQELQGVVYLLNQDSSARGGQSVFWNISIFDKGFFNGMFENYIYPDYSKPSWESLNGLQKFFHKWFREERKTKLLTFPVVTVAVLGKDGEWLDKDAFENTANEMALGSEFFIYTSETADSLSSCCRLKNEVDNISEFSYSLGAGGVATGSKNVITINVNRMVQVYGREYLGDIVHRVQLYQLAFDRMYTYMYEQKMLPVYEAGFISLEKQFLTIGLNGVLESAEFLGYEVSNNPEYKAYLSEMFGEIKEYNKFIKATTGVMMNTEIVPAENLGVKNAKWDRKDGIVSNRDCYNSYFYITEGTDSVFDKMEMHGGDIVKSLDGGSALHFNNNERLDREQYETLLKGLITSGCNYFCENVPTTVCTDCGHIHKNNVSYCIKCGSQDVKYAVRVIGYLRLVENFSNERKTEAGIRNYETL